jgi:hypothetical protein
MPLDHSPLTFVRIQCPRGRKWPRKKSNISCFHRPHHEKPRRVSLCRRNSHGHRFPDLNYSTPFNSIFRSFLRNRTLQDKKNNRIVPKISQVSSKMTLNMHDEHCLKEPSKRRGKPPRTSRVSGPKRLESPEMGGMYTVEIRDLHIVV